MTTKQQLVRVDKHVLLIFKQQVFVPSYTVTNHTIAITHFIPLYVYVTYVYHITVFIAPLRYIHKDK